MFRRRVPGFQRRSAEVRFERMMDGPSWAVVQSCRRVAEPPLEGDAVTPRLDVVFGIEYGRASIRSEYRDLVDNNFLPIEQTTRLAAAHVTGELRYTLLPRGDAVSRLAWVPRRAVPYVGVGAGAVRYRLNQAGDFVDYTDQSVFSDVLVSGGWAPTVHAFGGVDLHVRRGLFATLEARYVWADVPLDSTFQGFDPIDLAGFRTSAGIRLVF